MSVLVNLRSKINGKYQFKPRNRCLIRRNHYIILFVTILTNLPKSEFVFLLAAGTVSSSRNRSRDFFLV